MGKYVHIVLLLFFLFFLPITNPVYADSCIKVGIPQPITDPSPIPEGIKEAKLTFINVADGTYRLRIAKGIISNIHNWTDPQTASLGRVTLIVKDEDRNLKGVKHEATLEKLKDPSNLNSWGDFCDNVQYEVGYSVTSCKMSLTPRDPTVTDQIRIDIKQAPVGEYHIRLNIGRTTSALGKITIGNDGTGSTTIGPLSTPMSNAELFLHSGRTGPFCIVPNFTILAGGGGGLRAPLTATHSSTPASAAGTPCDYDLTIGMFKPVGKGLQTAIGCVPTQPNHLIAALLIFALGIGGGFAFLLMLAGVIQMITSAGNPDSLKGGQEMFTSAIIGILFIIFSVLFLQIIGVGILNIPGFS